jgi:hypothetical protein
MYKLEKPARICARRPVSAELEPQLQHRAGAHRGVESHATSTIPGVSAGVQGFRRGLEEREPRHDVWDGPEYAGIDRSSEYSECICPSSSGYILHLELKL